MQLTKLTTKYVGKNQYYCKTIDSTQKEIYRQIENNTIKNGTIVYSDIQTSGVGTHGRTWYTDQKNNIAFSLYIELNTKIDNLEGLTLEIAECLVDIFKKLYDIEINIKLPNDLYIKDKKVGGILTETKVLNGIVKYLILGIGINTNKTSFPEEIKDIATSIYKEYRFEIDSKEIIQEFVNKFENLIEKRK